MRVGPTIRDRPDRRVARRERRRHNWSAPHSPVVGCSRRSMVARTSSAAPRAAGPEASPAPAPSLDEAAEGVAEHQDLSSVRFATTTTTCRAARPGSPCDGGGSTTSWGPSGSVAAAALPALFRDTWCRAPLPAAPRPTSAPRVDVFGQSTIVCRHVRAAPRLEHEQRRSHVDRLKPHQMLVAPGGRRVPAYCVSDRRCTEPFSTSSRACRDSFREVQRHLAPLGVLQTSGAGCRRRGGKFPASGEIRQADVCGWVAPSTSSCSHLISVIGDADFGSFTNDLGPRQPVAT